MRETRITGGFMLPTCFNQLEGGIWWQQQTKMACGTCLLQRTKHQLSVTGLQKEGRHRTKPLASYGGLAATSLSASCSRISNFPSLTLRQRLVPKPKFDLIFFPPSLWWDGWFRYIPRLPEILGEQNEGRVSAVTRGSHGETSSL